MAGYSLLDRKSSDDIKDKLKIYNLNDKIQQYRNQWLSHAERMEQHRYQDMHENIVLEEDQVADQGRDGQNKFWSCSGSYPSKTNCKYMYLML
jgi:hypothetical protein